MTVKNINIDVQYKHADNDWEYRGDVMAKENSRIHTMCVSIGRTTDHTIQI